MNFAEPAGEAECEDGEVTEAPETAGPTEECQDPVEAEADECADDEGNEVAPELNIRIEPAEIVEDYKIYYCFRYSSFYLKCNPLNVKKNLHHSILRIVFILPSNAVNLTKYQCYFIVKRFVFFNCSIHV